ncbi:MAG TPA: hypothetical protein VEA60_00390 [Allosphingosinicella sp.]|nr:hypothetical protein [Allosphingosinicella sp.]
MTIDARGPVVAWAAGGTVAVRRWNGAAWAQLGSVVNEPASVFRDPALAVTGEGRLVVAYTRQESGTMRVEAKAWNGSGWTQLGSGLPTPSRSPGVAGLDSGAPVAAYLGGADSRVSLWNGSSWNPPSHPCPPPVMGSTLAPPSLAVDGNRIRVLCAIGETPFRRKLFARMFDPLFGWSQLGGVSINGPIRLAGPIHLAYVARTAPGGRLWAAWAADSPDGSAIIVSTLEPIPLATP